MILALGHKQRVGKDTCADYLVRQHGAYKFSFADALKEQAKVLYPHLTHNQLYGEAKDQPDPLLEGKTPRQILVLLGSATRQALGPNIYLQRLRHLVQEGKHSLIVVSDLRTQIEFKYIESLPTGFNIRIQRPSVAQSSARIENELNNADWDYEIENTGGFRYLFEQVNMAYQVFHNHITQ
uniref:Uncharacterized protein n=1 Tax=viral metagenome TaxID=1070528 RepID=A0A6C0BPY6_9ZZZZ